MGHAFSGYLPFAFTVVLFAGGGTQDVLAADLWAALYRCEGGLAALRASPKDALEQAMDRVRWRLRDWGPLRRYFGDDHHADLFLRPDPRAPKITLWQEAVHSPIARVERSGSGEVLRVSEGEKTAALEFDAASFGRLRVCRQYPEMGTVLHRLSGGQLAEWLHAVYREVMVSAFREPAAIDLENPGTAFGAGFRLIKPKRPNPVYGDLQFVQDRRSGKNLFGIVPVQIPGGKPIAFQLLLPVPEPVSFLSHDFTSAEARAIVLTVTVPEKGRVRVWDMAPLAEPSQRARSVRRERLVELLLPALREERERARAAYEAAWLPLRPELFRRLDAPDLENPFLVYTVVGYALAGGAVAGILTSLLSQAPTVETYSGLGSMGAAVGMLCSILSLQVRWRDWAAYPGWWYRRRQYGLSQALLKERLEALDQEFYELAPFWVAPRSTARELFEAGETPRMALYALVSPAARAYLRDEEPGMTPPERQKMLSLFQRAENQNLSESEVEALVTLLRSAPLPSPGGPSEYALAYQAADAYLKEHAKKNGQELRAVDLDEIYRRTRARR